MQLSIRVRLNSEPNGMMVGGFADVFLEDPVDPLQLSSFAIVVLGGKAVGLIAYHTVGLVIPTCEFLRRIERIIYSEYESLKLKSAQA